jgi:type III pantothenate kinase
MKILCIDVGNTSAHYGIVEEQSVSDSGQLPTASLRSESHESFSTTLDPLLAKVEGISFCSVVPEINQHLIARFQSTDLPVFQLTHLNCHGLDIAYPKPGEIGQDRLANAIAAQEYFGIPSIILDMGTAVTLDVVSSLGYEGGIIAPGLAVMTNYLHEQTALLPKLNEEDLLQVEGVIGKSTVHAMKLGVAIGFSGMLDALLTRVFKELKDRDGVPPIVLSTGGSIPNLTREWAAKSRFVENLTLTGLATAFNRNLIHKRP